MTTRTIDCDPSWRGFCIVAAPGPSLTPAVAEACKGYPTVAVNDACRLFPDADILYACDAEWWHVHCGAPKFSGERWSSQGDRLRDDKREAAAAYDIKLIRGTDQPGFSYRPDLIHYGNNSGYQATNIAGHKIGWNGTIVLVGFDMRRVKGRSHFFGEHPSTLRTTRTGYDKWPKLFAEAAHGLPQTVRIVNCTPDSALTCFPMVELADALSAAPRY